MEYSSEIKKIARYIIEVRKHGKQKRYIIYLITIIGDK